MEKIYLVVFKIIGSKSSFSARYKYDSEEEMIKACDNFNALKGVHFDGGNMLIVPVIEFKKK